MSQVTIRDEKLLARAREAGGFASNEAAVESALRAYVTGLDASKPFGPPSIFDDADDDWDPKAVRQSDQKRIPPPLDFDE